LAFLISLASIIGFCFMSLWISNHKIIRFDNTIIGYVQGWEAPELTQIMKFFTFIGSAPFVVVLSLILLFFLYKVQHHRMELILFVYAVIGSAILNQLLKHCWRVFCKWLLGGNCNFVFPNLQRKAV